MSDDTSDADYITGMYELFDAVDAVIRAADPAKRVALAQTMDACQRGCWVEIPAHG